MRPFCRDLFPIVGWHTRMTAVAAPWFSRRVQRSSGSEMYRSVDQKTATGSFGSRVADGIRHTSAELV